MKNSRQIDQQHQEDLQRLRGFRLLDDDFLRKCFESDSQYIELVLRIVPETYVVFITEHDVIGKGKPLCRISRYVL